MALFDAMETDVKPKVAFAQAGALSHAGGAVGSSSNLAGAAVPHSMRPEPVASTSRVTLDSSMQQPAAPSPAAASGGAHDDLYASATDIEDGEVDSGVDQLESTLGDDHDDQDDSSDEEPLRSVQRKQTHLRRTEAVKGMYTAAQVLPEEEFGSKTVAEIYAMLNANVINLTPDYQRDSVWPEAQAAGLIESLLRNMHVPEILFNTYAPEPEDPWYTVVSAKSVIQAEGTAPLPRGFNDVFKADEVEADPDLLAALGRGELVPREVWNCADGKQRMTSIKRFMDGDLSITSTSGERHVYKELPREAKELLDRKRLRYGFYRELSDGQEREIFRRVQLGKQLDKGEIMRAIDSPYAEWVQNIMDKLFSPKTENIARSLRPRVVSGKRGLPLKASYSMSRNLLYGVKDMKFESDTVRTRTMESAPVPGRAKEIQIDGALTRFLELTLVPPLPGEDRWPKTDSYSLLRKHRVPVPHRVWRLRPKDVQAHANKKIDAVAVAPVELNILPAVIERFKDLCDGDLLELVQLLRTHLHNTFPGEMKDNTKLYNAVKTWVEDFQPATLKHKYKDDGSLRKRGESATPVDARPPKRKLPREGPADSPLSSNKRAALHAASLQSRASLEPLSRQSQLDREREERTERRESEGSSAGSKPLLATAQGSASASLGSRAAAGSPREARPAEAPRQQQQQQAAPPPPPPPVTSATPIPAGMSNMHAKFAARALGNGSNGVNGTAPTYSTIQSLPFSKRKTNRFDERGRLIYEDFPPPPSRPQSSENDVSLAFQNPANDDVQRVLQQRQPYGVPPTDPLPFATSRSAARDPYGADCAIGGPPPHTHMEDERDIQARAILQQQRRPQDSYYRRSDYGGGSNGGMYTSGSTSGVSAGGGGSTSAYGGRAHSPTAPVRGFTRYGDPPPERSAPVDNGWNRRAASAAPGSNVDGARGYGDPYRASSDRDRSYGARPETDLSQRPVSVDPRRRL